MLRRKPNIELATAAWRAGHAPVRAVRFETGDCSFSFLVSEVRSWVLRSDGERDALIVRIGRQIFTVRGAGLFVIRDALEQQRLHVLKISSGRTKDDSGVFISAIEVGEE